MEKNTAVQETTAVSTEKVILLIKQTRDQLITELLKDAKLNAFLEKNYDILAISAIKTEFLKRSLKELRDTSIDLVHYSSLIKQLKESHLTIEKEHPLFLLELKTIFQKYGY